MTDDLPQRTDHDIPQARLELEPDDVGFDPTQSLSEMADDSDSLFKQAMEQTRMAICISDPNQPDCPIVFVNQAFVEATGYDREEIVGRNCRFLQGPGTSQESIAKIRQTIADEEVRVTEILNYKKDGTPFWNALHIGPVYGKDGQLTHYYGSQWDVTDIVEERERAYMQKKVMAELQHRTNNLFTVVDAIVRLSARGQDDAGALATTISERIHALSRAHRMSITPVGERSEPSDLHALTEAILRPYRTDGRGPITLGGPQVRLDPDKLRTVGLALHELATNALKYGALSVPSGSVAIAWTVEDEDLAVTWTETGGPRLDGKAPKTRGSGTGIALVRGMTRGEGGGLDLDWREEGLVATLRVRV